MGAEDRTEEPTPRRREEARKRGQVAKTRELSSTLLLLFSLLFFYFTYRSVYRTFGDLFVYFLGNAYSSEVRQQTLMVVLYVLAKLLLPLFILLIAVSIFSYVIQFGFLFTTEVFTPKFDFLNPINGLKNLFSKKALVELAKAAVKFVFVFAVVYPIIKKEILIAPQLFSYEPGPFFTHIFKTAAVLVFKVGILFLFLSILDYGFQKWEYEQSLKMTKEEVKEELKQQEGDPQVKARIRRIQRELARKRMMQEVPKADVVITNPVEIAVALKYDAKRMNAPIVVAKGAGEIAKKIREIAKKHGVPIVENRALARMLYKMVEVGEEIPEALYKAVAEVLAYVYRQKGKAA